MKERKNNEGMDTAPFTLSLSKGEEDPPLFVLRLAQHERAFTKGFTLAEVAITLLVFAISMVMLAGVYFGFASLTWSNRNLSQALNDARVVMEQIRDTSAGGLSAVTNTPWAAWAASSTGGNLTDPLTRTNPSPLSGETVQVQYTSVWGNPQTPTADPLPVIVRVDWSERGRARSAMVNTLVTRR